MLMFPNKLKMPSKPAIFRSPFVATMNRDVMRGSATARGYDGQWRRLRKVHLTANPLCHNCGNFATIVDHIVPVVIAPERRLDRSNLRSCCVECHNQITTNFRTTGVNELPEVKK